MTHILYHKLDLDGHCSGAIARYFTPECKMYPYNYGDQFPFDEIKDGEKVLMVDCSTNPKDLMLELDRRYDLFVIDHHVSFIESDIAKFLKGVFVNGRAACSLTWDHFSPNTKMPDLVHLLGKYDVWDNEDKKSWNERILPIQMGMKMYPTDPGTDEGYEIWENYFYDYLNEPGHLFPMIDRHYVDLEFNLRNSGTTILEYQKQEDAKTAKLFAFEAEFDGMKAICMNSTRFNTMVFESVWDKEKYDIMMGWANVKGEYFTCSMYTNKEGIDVSKIAVKHGGGGHVQAAGFQCKNVTLIDGKIVID